MVETTSILDIEPEKLTPGMRQYQDAKRANPDCLILLRMGDFYEMFYEDAVTAARELEITLTARGKGEKRAPLAGVPYHALETYLGRLVKKGYKVAIIEQLEDPKKAKGLVKRGLVRIVTPGTIMEGSMLNEKENNYVMALSCHDDIFPLAFCDLSTGEFFTTSARTVQSVINEMIRLNPSECIVPASLQVNHELMKKIKVTGCFVNSTEDYFYKTDKAEETLLNHFNISSLSSFGLQEDKLQTAVSGALMRYLIDTQKNSLSHIKKIFVKSNRETMLLDASTFRNLELVKNIRDGSNRGSLLGILDKSTTALGSRLLRKWLKEPLLKQQLIERRLNAVEALNKNIISREDIVTLLKNVYDIERLIGRVNYGTANPRDLLSLKSSLQQIPLLKSKLSDFSSELLTSIGNMPELGSVSELINNSIKDEAPITIREGGMIKTSYNSELAELHAIKTNSKAYLQEIENKEKERTGILSLKIRFTRVFGYFIEVTKKNVPFVPNDYIRKQTTTNSERYITEELKTVEEKILGAQEKIQELEYRLFQEIVEKIAEKTIEMQDAAGKISVLDVLCSLSKVAMENGYCKPKFVDRKVLQIRAGRHPVVEKIESRFIANDIYLDNGEMMIITGPNMAGKSTLQRQVALTVLMAQMGSYVPAKEVILGIFDRIFTRVGASDDLSAGQSTFMVEMNETASILHNATENSLVILDEIGRGTSTFDGVSLAWSVAEHIHNKIKAKTLFATHYHVMNKLEQKFDRIKNYNIAVKESKGEVIFLRKLLPGGTDQSYGIHVAKLAGLPSSVVDRAKEIQTILEKDDDMVRRIKAKKLREQMSLDKF